MIQEIDFIARLVGTIINQLVSYNYIMGGLLGDFLSGQIAMT